MSVRFAVSFGQRKFSDLAFSFVWRRPSLLLQCAGYVFVEPLVGVFFYDCSCCACGFVQRDLSQVTLQLLCNFSGYVCLSCSCAGGVGWAADLSLCGLSASPVPAGLPMGTGCSTLCGWFCRRGCDFSLSGSIVVP